MKRLIILIIALVISATFMLQRTFRSVRRHEASFHAMGGMPVNVVAYGVRRGQFKMGMREVALYVNELEDIFNEYRTDSEISQLNRLGKGCMEDVSPALIALLKDAKLWSRVTGGAFDVTVGPLIDLWKRAAKDKRIPTEEEIAEAKSRVGMQHVTINDDSVCLDRDKMKFALGGIAKGAILDEATLVLRRSRIARGLVDAGGDVASFGKGTFNVGIQSPGKQGKLYGSIMLPAGGVVTSGDYERFVTIDGKNYSHIIDPRSGRPADELVSVTVMGPDATNADALATAISVLGKKRGVALMERLPNFRAVIMSHDGSVWMSDDLRALVKY